MTKTFSTKLDVKVIHSLDELCHRHHLKKSRLVEEILLEGIERRAAAFDFAKSLERGLEQEKAGDLLTTDQVEKMVFERKAEQLQKIANSDPKSARIISDHLKKLPQTYHQDPFLSGPRYQGLRRNRIGRYRAIYRVMEQEKEIRIITIDLRKSVYER